MDKIHQSEHFYNAVHEATYCRVTGADGFAVIHTREKATHVGFFGQIQNRGSLTRSGGKFSVNTQKQPPLALKPTGRAPHHWVYPHTHSTSDTIELYDAACNLLGIWQGSTHTYISTGQKPVNPVVVNGNSIVSKEFLQEGASVFTATTAKAKGGYRAQVVYQSNQKVVWESSEVYADDDDYQQEDYDDGVRGKGKSGQTKAQEAAASVVDKVVEGLFDNVG